jgi:hypothetical protein
VRLWLTRLLTATQWSMVSSVCGFISDLTLHKCSRSIVHSAVLLCSPQHTP